MKLLRFIAVIIAVYCGFNSCQKTRFPEELTENEEICNSLNRRTEFTVLRTTYGLFDENGNLKAQPKPAKKPESSSDDVDFEFYE